jgi:hypothetical protein
VNRIENNRVTAIDLVVLEKLANALGEHAALLIAHLAVERKGKQG